MVDRLTPDSGELQPAIGPLEFLGTAAGGAAIVRSIGAKFVGRLLGKATRANPFRGKPAEQIDEMLRAKGFEPRGPDPVHGKGGYVNPRSTRSYHIDEANSFGEPPHVDVNRPKGYKGPLDKKKFNMGSDDANI